MSCPWLLRRADAARRTSFSSPPGPASTTSFAGCGHVVCTTASRECLVFFPPCFWKKYGETPKWPSLAARYWDATMAVEMVLKLVARRSAAATARHGEMYRRGLSLRLLGSTSSCSVACFAIMVKQHETSLPQTHSSIKSCCGGMYGSFRGGNDHVLAATKPLPITPPLGHPPSTSSTHGSPTVTAQRSVVPGRMQLPACFQHKDEPVRPPHVSSVWSSRPCGNVRCRVDFRA